MTAVSVVIVNWNGEKLLPACLASVAAQRECGPVETIVVDNLSTDGSLALLERDFAGVRVLKNAVNNYAGANNLGVAASRAPLVLLLNSDAQLEPGSLAILVRALETHENAAGVMPKILYPDGKLYTTGVVETEDLYWLDRDHGAVDDGRRDRGETLLALSGCCALHRKSAWEAVGGLDDDFHMYYEDVEFSLRLRERGYELRYEPQARVRHVGHASIDLVGEGAKDPLGERNRLLVLARHRQDRFARFCVRSPWFQSASPDEVRWLVDRCAIRLSGSRADALTELVLGLRDEVRSQVGEIEGRYGQHANLPKILAERESWIGMLLREVRRLRIWRLPGKRLKPGEKLFLERLELRARGENV